MTPFDDFPRSLCDAIEAMLEAQHKRSTGDESACVEIAHSKLVKEIREFAEQCASDAVDGVTHGKPFRCTVQVGGKVEKAAVTARHESTTASGCRWDGLCSDCRSERRRGDGETCPNCGSATRARKNLGRLCQAYGAPQCVECAGIDERIRLLVDPVSLVASPAAPPPTAPQG